VNTELNLFDSALARKTQLVVVNKIDLPEVQARLAEIRDAFNKTEYTPYTFFAGAAIEKKMAEEIWEQLQDGTLNNAANITNHDQIASICHWIITI